MSIPKGLFTRRIKPKSEPQTPPSRPPVRDTITTTTYNADGTVTVHRFVPGGKTPVMGEDGRVTSSEYGGGGETTETVPAHEAQRHADSTTAAQREGVAIAAAMAMAREGADLTAALKEARGDAC